jgi:DNA-binding CsgD family transcriptional regulator
VAVIEAAYRTDESPGDWLKGVAGAVARSFGGAGGAIALSYDARRDDWIEPLGVGLHEIDEALARSLFLSSVPAATPEDQLELVKTVRSVGFGSFRDQILPRIPALGAALSAFGVEDLVCVNATDPTYFGCVVCVPARHRTISPRLATLWRRLGAHIAAGNRLRRALATLGGGPVPPIDRAEAILASPERVEHAVGAAAPRAAREALKNALARIDRARSAREDEFHSVELWKGLVSGRWSIVEHFETDGRRYYLAYRNDPELAADRALTRREKQVLSYAMLGHSNKLIAYSLGLSVSSVGTHLARARRKLGSAVPPEIVHALPAPTE